MKHLTHLLFAASALLVASCSNNDQFRVNGTLEGKPTMNIRAGYYADGAFRSIITAAREGEFEFFGSSTHPTILEITDYDYRPIGRLFVSNGETFTIKIDASNPYSVEASGNEVSEKWAKFLRENEDELRKGGQSVIEQYVAAHPADILSTILILTAYDSSNDPVRADSIMQLIDPQVRPSNLTEGYNFLLERLVSSSATGEVATMQYIDRRDSLRSFNTSDQAYSLIVLSTQETERRDIVPTLRSLHKAFAKKGLAILDYSLDADTVEWKRGTRPDSADWKQGWVPGGLAAMSVDRLGAPSLPYAIVCDSTGTQIFRGESVKDAEKLIKSLFKKD